ncbi:accessory gene regulator ArgB-like protein [Microaerobacter geothermalis]|uniref:accessory gene regulator ArgB-like protein n=1 Tax=Microaerobacter geothermalis TaxID=674972 RepID=UPI0038B384B7
MITRLSQNLAKRLAKQTHQSQNEDHIRYGLEVIIGYSIKIVLLFILAYSFGITLPVLFLVLTFAGLRIVSGGTHLSTYLSCMVFSLLSFLLLSWLSVIGALQYKNHMILLNSATLMTGLFICYKYAPYENSRAGNRNRNIRFKILSIIFLSAWYLTVTLGYILEVDSTWHFILKFRYLLFFYNKIICVGIYCQ